MSEFSNGGGTLTSNNKVAAALEIATLLAREEKLASTPQIPLNNIQMNFAQDTLGVTITANLPCRFVTNSNNDMTIVARDYLGTDYPNFTQFDPGSGGDITATSYPYAFLQIAEIMSASESVIPTNIVQQTPNTTSIAYDREAGLATITMSLPVDFDVTTSGELMVKVIDFLP